MENTKKLLIVGNKLSVHTNNLNRLVGGYFQQTKILDNAKFSLHSPLQLLKAIIDAKKMLQTYRPSFIILYQVDIAAFFITLIKKNIPTLVVGIGSDILTVPYKSFANKFVAKYVINHGNYFNAGSIALKKGMQQLSSKSINIVIANLGTEDILPQQKQKIIYSNRLHKDIYNIDKIVTAFAKFIAKEQNKDWTLIIAATGKEKELYMQARELKIENNVKFVGWLNKEQNAYWYSVAKIWVSLPASDSISISLLEAMSAECIPVCYDVPALDGFLSNNVNAVIVNNFNENFFERALSLDKQEILSKNRLQSRDFADKDINRKKFYDIFDKEFNHSIFS